MANMVLRLSDEETQQLRRVAEQERRSMHDVAISAVRDKLHERRRIQDEFMDQWAERHADLLDRLSR